MRCSPDGTPQAPHRPPAGPARAAGRRLLLRGHKWEAHPICMLRHGRTATWTCHSLTCPHSDIEQARHADTPVHRDAMARDWLTTPAAHRLNISWRASRLGPGLLIRVHVDGIHETAEAQALCSDQRGAAVTHPLRQAEHTWRHSQMGIELGSIDTSDLVWLAKRTACRGTELHRAAVQRGAVREGGAAFFYFYFSALRHHTSDTQVGSAALR